jgi:hypothetical protein
LRCIYGFYLSLANLIESFMKTVFTVALLAISSSAFADGRWPVSVPFDATLLPSQLSATLSPTQKMVIRVPECRGCGVSWQIGGLDASLAQQTQRKLEPAYPAVLEVSDGTSGPLPGGSWVRVLTFPKLNVGHYDIILKYGKPGEIYKEMDISVEVTARNPTD